MGKKFLKFIRDPAGRVKDKAKGNSQPDTVPVEEAAQSLHDFVQEFEPLASQEELQHTLSNADDGAQRYASQNIEIGELAEVDATAMLRQLAEEAGMEFIDLAKRRRPPDDVIALLDIDQAQNLVAVPVGRSEEGVPMIAISDPTNPVVTDSLHSIIDGELELVVAVDGEIRERINTFYGMGEESLEDVINLEEVRDETEKVATDIVNIDFSDPEAVANQKPVIRLVNLLLVKAIKERASDIHIEPFPKLVRIRYRVDGVLREIPSPPRSMYLGIISRIKVIAKLDIAEARLPQDGRIKLSVEGRDVELRVSTIATVHGEACVMRILDKTMMQIGLGQIGMSDDVLEGFMKHIHKPNGIILVTGPTGCGKTTTLYAGIHEIKDPGEKMITVEDPVEFEIPGVTQVNVNENVGLTFSRCIRAILRQDPDTVLIGEIRDVETAQIAIQAALTGHLVMSTLHTNSAAATMTRLIDMGIKPFLITSSVEAVIGQRLVRTICPNCRIAYTPNAEDIEEFNIDEEELKEFTFFMGEGCSDCGHSGYRGRMGLYELLGVDEEMRELILDQASTDELQEMAVRKGMVSMRQDGWTKICMGLTTFEEVARETPRDASEEEFEPASDTEDEKKPEELSKPEEPKAELPKPDAPALEAPPKALPKINEGETAIEGEAAAQIHDIGDASREPRQG